MRKVGRGSAEERSEKRGNLQDFDCKYHQNKKENVLNISQCKGFEGSLKIVELPYKVQRGRYEEEGRGKLEQERKEWFL